MAAGISNCCSKSAAVWPTKKRARSQDHKSNGTHTQNKKKNGNRSFFEKLNF
jgi:predicted lipoprotein with Yx(FWY)xxD motif